MNARSVPDPREGVRAPASRDAGAGCRGGGRCGGVGFVQVSPAYADRLFPAPPQPSLEDQDQAAAWAALAATLETRRAAARDSWYPCKDCNGAVFYRWAGRHLDSDHQRAGCAECELALEGTIRKRPGRHDAVREVAAPTPQPAHQHEEF